MNQLFAGGAALVLTLFIWSLGKRPNKLTLKNKDADSLSGLNREQMSLVQLSSSKTFQSSSDKNSAQAEWQSPLNPQEQLKLLRKLRKLTKGGPEERLEAISIAFLWGHPKTLPFLRRGLKDADSRIVNLAAAALNNHRGKTTKKIAQVERPPRNVALMR